MFYDIRGCFKLPGKCVEESIGRCLERKKIKHKNRLSINDVVVQRIRDAFDPQELDGMLIYTKIRVCYWHHYESYEQLKNKVFALLGNNNINNFNEFINQLSIIE
jgi:hypothetical protein